MTNNERLDPGFWIGLILIVILILCTQKCKAQKIDTIPCHVECIVKIVQKPTSKSVKYLAVYKCAHMKIQDIIPMSKTVYQYMRTAIEYGIQPELGIRLRDGSITSIIKRKRRLK